MFDSVAITLSDYLRIGLSDAYLVIFAAACLIAAKFWLPLEKLNALYFGLVTGLLVYLSFIGLANTPLPSIEGGDVSAEISVWISRCGYFILFAFPIGSMVKGFGSKEKASHPHAILAEDILTYFFTTILITLLFISLSEARFVWSGSPIQGVFSEYSWYTNILQSSEYYKWIVLHTREILLGCILFWLYKEFFRPLVVLAIVSLLASLHASVSSLSQSLDNKLGKGGSGSDGDAHSSGGDDHGGHDEDTHDNHGHNHGDIVVDHSHHGGHH